MIIRPYDFMNFNLVRHIVWLSHVYRNIFSLDSELRVVVVLGKASRKKSPELSGIFPTLVNPLPPGIREIHQKMKKIFFAFLNELDHSKQFLKK